MSHLRGAMAALFLVPVAGESATLEASFGSATDIPVSAPSYQAAGNAVSFSLGFAPAAGMRLTVVNITGLDPIEGEFSNLAHGQTVVLSHGGTDYPFVANYFGGNGNDLVLHPAETEVFSWGSNSFSQLGVAMISNGVGSTGSAVPLSVKPLVPGLRHRIPVSIACGPDHMLALRSDGAVIGWGRGEYGRLGNGALEGAFKSAELVRSGVLAGKTIKSIAVGNEFGMALCTDGTLASWGDNSKGQLGTGPASTGSKASPVLVDQSGVLAGRQVVSIAAGGDLALAVCADGGVVSWGSGALGRGGLQFNRSPGDVDRSGVLASRSVVSIHTNGSLVLAICSDGSAVTWGGNSFGQLGVGDKISRVSPELVDRSTTLAGKSVVAGAVGFYHAIVLCSDGSLASWGYNSHGPLGNGTTTDSLVPVPVDQSGVLAGRPVVSINAAGYGSFAMCSDGLLVGWGDVLMEGYDQKKPFAIGNLGVLAGRVVVQAAVGNGVAAALCSDGTLAAWMRRGSGQTGFFEVPGGTLPFSVVPEGETTHPFGQPVLSLANGRFHSHALLADGSVWSWGSNSFGQLGAGLASWSIGQSLEPVKVAIPGFSETRRVAAIAAGMNHSLALCTDGSLFAWGGAGYGLLGDAGQSGSSQSPVPVDQSGALSGKRVIRIRAEEKFSMALCSDGSLVTWGENFPDKTGNGGPDVAYTPVLVARNGALAGKSIVDFCMGPANLLALCSDGSLVAWGWNTHGSLGDGSKLPRTSPVAVDMSGVLAGKSIVDMAIRGSQVNVLCADGTVASWGSTDLLLPLLPNNLMGGIDDSLPAIVDLSSLLDSGEIPVDLESKSENLLVTTSRGRAIAVGKNGAGQLGNGSMVNPPGPVMVDSSGALSGARVSFATAGENHATAIANRRRLLGSLSAGGGSIPVRREMILEVAEEVSSLSLTAVSMEPAAQITIGGLAHASGVQGPALPLAHGPNRIPILLTTPAGDSETCLLVVKRGWPSTVSALASLVPDKGELSPGFEAGRFLYAVDLPYQASGIRFTAAAADAGASILIDGSTAPDGALLPEIALPVGETPVSVRVNAADGIRYSVYTVVVRRAAPPPATLASLKPSIGDLKPLFNPSTTSYQLTVPESASSIRWLPVATDGGSRVGIQGAGVVSGAWSGAHSLRHGLNRFTIAVTNIAAETVTYSVDVTRNAASAAATLKSLRLSNAVLKPAFKSTVATYGATVSAMAKSVTVTPVATDAKALIRINGKLLKPGSRSAVVALGGSSTVIRIQVTAPNGKTVKTYTVTASRGTAKKSSAAPVTLVRAQADGATPITYQDWVSRHFVAEERTDPAIAGMQASPCGDGIANLVKFALGLDAGPASRDDLPAVALSGGRLVMTYKVLRPAAGVRLSVEGAGSPSGPWKELLEGSSSRGSDGVVTFTVVDFPDSPVPPMRFMRLKVVAD